MGNNVSVSEKVYHAIKSKDLLGLLALCSHEEKANLLDWTDKDGRNALMIAVRNGYYEAAAVLIRAGANVHLLRSAPHPQTGALHEAVQRGQEAMVELLLSAGASPFVANNKGHTVLDLALSLGHLPVIRCLERRALFNGTVLVKVKNSIHMRAFKSRWAVVMPHTEYAHPVTRTLLWIYKDSTCTVPVTRVWLDGSSVAWQDGGAEAMLRLHPQHVEPQNVASDYKHGYIMYFAATGNAADSRASLARLMALADPACPAPNSGKGSPRDAKLSHSSLGGVMSGVASTAAAAVTAAGSGIISLVRFKKALDLSTNSPSTADKSAEISKVHHTHHPAVSQSQSAKHFSHTTSSLVESASDNSTANTGESTWDYSLRLHLMLNPSTDESSSIQKTVSTASSIPSRPHSLAGTSGTSSAPRSRTQSPSPPSHQLHLQEPPFPLALGSSMSPVPHGHATMVVAGQLLPTIQVKGYTDAITWGRGSSEPSAIVLSPHNPFFSAKASISRSSASQILDHSNVLTNISAHTNSSLAPHASFTTAEGSHPITNQSPESDDNSNPPLLQTLLTLAPWVQDCPPTAEPSFKFEIMSPLPSQLPTHPQSPAPESVFQNIQLSTMQLATTCDPSCPWLLHRSSPKLSSISEPSASFFQRSTSQTYTESEPTLSLHQLRLDPFQSTSVDQPKPDPLHKTIHTKNLSFVPDTSSISFNPLTSQWDRRMFALSLPPSPVPCSLEASTQTTHTKGLCCVPDTSSSDYEISLTSNSGRHSSVLSTPFPSGSSCSGHSNHAIALESEGQLPSTSDTSIPNEGIHARSTRDQEYLTLSAPLTPVVPSGSAMRYRGRSESDSGICSSSRLLSPDRQGSLVAVGRLSTAHATAGVAMQAQQKNLKQIFRLHQTKWPVVEVVAKVPLSSSDTATCSVCISGCCNASFS